MYISNHDTQNHPFCRTRGWNVWTLKINETTNQNSIRSPMLLCKRINRQYHKTLGTSVINSPCSLAPWQYKHKNHRSQTLSLIQIIKYTLIYSLDPNSNCLSNLEINVDFNAIVTILWNWKHLDDNIQDFWQRNNTTYRVFFI